MNTSITHFHMCCGIGGGALGFQQATPRIPGLQAEYRCLGGIDVDPACVRDFSRLVGVDGTCLDLFNTDQYTAWHGSPPPFGWQEAIPEDIRRAAHNESPNVVFMSPPCKGFSGLLPEKSSRTPKYQAMNQLALRCVWLALEAWSDTPPEFFLLENVPRIATRGRGLLDQISGLLHQYGYAVSETVHDCGLLGGLAQSRKRFLLVARHMEKVPPYLYQPTKKPLRTIGEVIDSLPVPIGPQANPMHRIPNLSWRTWMRLALIPPGGDWRSLRHLQVEDGVLADYLIHATPRDDHLGVHLFSDTMGTITGRSGATNGAFSIADPGIRGGKAKKDYSTGNLLGVVPWTNTSGGVTGSACHDNGPWSIADPRVNLGEKSYGQYGVSTMDQPAHAVTGAATHRNGWWTIADPRTQDQFRGVTKMVPPGPDTKGVFLIRALHGGAWHRPFTTLELAHLQGFIDMDTLDGQSDTRWRMSIGNAVPPPAARAIAEVIGRTILLARAGETFVLSSTPIWVKPLIAAVSIETHQGF